MTHSNVNFMRLEIKLEAEKKLERKSKIPIEPPWFYKKERMQVLRQINEQGNDLLNILICVQGKDCNLPDIALDQMTKSVVLAKKASAMFRAIRDPKENVVDRDLHANNHADMILNFSPRSAAGADAQQLSDLRRSFE